MKRLARYKPVCWATAGFLAIAVSGLLINLWLLYSIAMKWAELLRLIAASK